MVQPPVKRAIPAGAGAIRTNPILALQASSYHCADNAYYDSRNYVNYLLAYYAYLLVYYAYGT